MCKFELRHSKPILRKVPALHSRQGTDNGRASTLAEGAWQSREASPAADFSFGRMKAGPMAARPEPVRMEHDAMERRV